MLRALAFGLLAAMLPLTGAAQSNENDALCDEGWLSHNWAEVAVRCNKAGFDAAFSLRTVGNASEVQLAIKNGVIDASATTPPNIDATDDRARLLLAKEIAFGNYFISAGQLGRAAFAYYQLKQTDDGKSSLAMARTSLETALSFADDAQQRQAKRLVSLLNNPKFPRLKLSDVSVLNRL